MENGLEFLEDIRHRYPHLPVVILTGNPEYSDWLDARIKGAEGYLWKINKSIPVESARQREFFMTLHELFRDVPHRPRTRATGRPMSDERVGALGARALWLNGLFFLLLLVMVVLVVAASATLINPWLVPLALLSSLLLYAMVGAFVLRSQGTRGLGERSFIELMREAFRLLPLIGHRPDST